jgi:FAD/FMN-containing dehydrogenase
MSVSTTIARARILDPEVIASLRGALTGDASTPADPAYERLRAVWNGMIDQRPAVVASCATTADVIAAVAFARRHDLPIAVRGGGHSVSGHSTCDDGIVIDLTPMKAIEVDPTARIVHAGAGVTWGELDAVTQEHGLATPGGLFSRTGIAGLTLGGGYGWLRGSHGLACDNLIAAEVVTADGRVVVAGDGDGEDSELLWGLRGGGGNFGIVTRFTFRLHPVGPRVFFTFVFHDGEGEAAERALQFYDEYCGTVPDQVSPVAVCGVIPPDEELFPAAIHGRRFVLFGAMYDGPVAEGERVLGPLRSLAEPLVDFSDVMPYVDVQNAFDADYPDGRRYYWKSLNLTRFDGEAIARVIDHARRQPSHLSTTDLWHIGGAQRRADPRSSAFYGRDARFLLGLEANWTDSADDEANVAWVREFVADMERFSDGSRYLNFAGFQEEGETMMRSGFGQNYDRLVSLKRRYDPTNLFRLNQNIDPTIPRR